MSIADELAQAKAKVAEYEQYLKAAYTALQSNGASLPEKCNAANLAGCIEESGGYAGVGLAVETTVGNITLVNTESSDYGYSFAYSCDISMSQSYVEMIYKIPTNGISCKIYKNTVTKLYINTPSDIPASLGGSGFGNMTSIETRGTSKIGGDFCEGAKALTDVSLGSVSQIGYGAFGRCIALTKLRLPDTLVQVGSAFCSGCGNLSEVFIPASAVPPRDSDTFATSKTSAAYVNGIILKGPGAKAWKAALPDSSEEYEYRKLILDPEWS